MTRKAYLFLDETGDFSPNGDDMRMVGGLLVLAPRDVSQDMEQIHTRLATALAWPVRMHARELVEPGCILRWHALGGAAQRALLQPAEIDALDFAVAEHPQVAPHSNGRRWSTITSVQRSSKHRPLLQQVGSRLLRTSQSMLHDAFQQWCTEETRAFLIAGHVDDGVPGGAQAYDTAMDQALRVAMRTAAHQNISDVQVEIAAPGVQTSADIERRASRAGIQRTRVVTYDDGSHGLWLADSLLAWTRPPPRSVIGSALHPRTGVRGCLRVASSSDITRPAVLETCFDYFRDAVMETGSS